MNNVNKRPRVFFLSFTPPLPSWGGSMTFFRHFIERDDFEVCVATNSTDISEYQLPYNPIQFSEPRWWKRIKNTRFHRWVMGMEQYSGSFLLPKRIYEQARHFKPDLVFTMAGSWNWTALAAKKVAQKLQVPLVASFNDWFDYPAFPGPPFLHKVIERQFRAFYREADLALCTSEGMRDALGRHPNSHVWYPTGAAMPSGSPIPKAVKHDAAKKKRVLFGGNLGEWYGRMLEDLVWYLNQRESDIEMRIFGSNASWTAKFEKEATRLGIFRGRVNFDSLRQEAENSDLLLLLMGFDTSCSHVERTSFKTKFLDYLTFRKPILIWGPEYCSAVRTARQFDSAECVTTPDPKDCFQAIQNLLSSSERCENLVNNANRMYHDKFHPDKIHAILVDEIHKLLAKQQRAR